jgi:S1-C subfamily serine protease
VNTVVGYTRFFRPLTAALAFAGLVFACAPQSSTTPARLTQENFTRLFEATVSIRVALPGGRSREGSGFVATRDGWVVTSYHVVGSESITPFLEYADSQASSTEEIYGWPNRDLAILVPRHPPSIEPLRLGDSERLEPGQVLFACGVPFGLGRTVTRGVIDGRTSFESPRYVVWDGILAEGLSYPGDSGGPVVTQDGRVVGVHLGSVSGQRRAVIPISLVRSTLIEARVRAQLLRQRRATDRASL